MARVVSVRVPEAVSEEGVVYWVAEGLSRRFAKRIVLRYRGGVSKEGIALALGSGVLFEIAMVGVGRCS